MKLNVSDIARNIGVDQNLVKEWAFHFKDYLSPSANPNKGKPRQFTYEDLRIFAYVYTCWEDEPDFECIKIGLNCGEQYSDQYDGLITSVIPIFDEPPDELDSTWQHVCLVGGMCDLILDKFTLAESYKLAGDTLVDAALSIAQPDELIYPILYNYRHSVELYLKDSVSPKNKKHDIAPLFMKLKETLKTDFSAEVPSWFEDAIMIFGDFDPDSTTFRYGDNGVFSRRTGEAGEFCVDLPHLKQVMTNLVFAFKRIKYACACRTVSE